MSGSEAFQCLNCHLGAVRRIRATYVRQFGAGLIVIPDAGAWQCDVCGEFVYDDETIVLTEILVGEDSSGRSQEQRQPPFGGAIPQPRQGVDHKRA